MRIVSTTVESASVVVSPSGCPFAIESSANEIERRWQDAWEAQHTFWAPNPTGPLTDGFAAMEGHVLRSVGVREAHEVS